jgi:hypothetical protein
VTAYIITVVCGRGRRGLEGLLGQVNLERFSPGPITKESGDALKNKVGETGRYGVAVGEGKQVKGEPERYRRLAGETQTD